MKHVEYLHSHDQTKGKKIKEYSIRELIELGEKNNNISLAEQGSGNKKKPKEHLQPEEKTSAEDD